MKIQAAVVHTKGQPFQIEEVELAAPKAGEVLVKVVACGMCHTDIVAQQQIIPVPLPAVFGHEGCGIVEEVGPGVTEFKPGDRVGFSYGWCGECEACRSGHPYGCEHNRELNFFGLAADGTKRLSQNGVELSTFFGQSAFATHAVVHQNNLIAVDADLDLALVAPMGCGIQTGAGAIFNYLKPECDSSIAIFGCGTVGLSAIMAAKIAGCSKIIAVDIKPTCLDLAKELGATHVIDAKDLDPVEEIHKIIPLGVNYAIDATGLGASVRRALNSVKPLGTCVVLGATTELTIHVENELMGPGKTLVGLVEGCSIPKLFIPKLLNYYKEGRFPFDKLIQFYDFQDINKAVEDTHNGKAIKAVLRMDK